MAKRRSERVLSRQDVPGRLGWALESVIEGTEKISVVVRNVYTGSGFQIASVGGDGILKFDRGSSLSGRMDKYEMLIHFALGTISEKDSRLWPSWTVVAESAKPFWRDFADELPNVLTVAEVLET